MRPRLLAANATVEWTPAYFGKRMDDWLRNMGDWNISRRRYFGLPLPIFPCSCGHVAVVGSRAELDELATAGMDQLVELHRPWIDAVEIRCPACGTEGVRRIPEIGDVWLDAGIVPFSTLGWENPEFVEGGYGTGAAKGLTGADLPDHNYWETWFPAHWVSEMREQIRLWFYSQLFMSVCLVDKAPFRSVLGYEKMLDEHGRPMHGSWGNLIPAEEAFARMGADVMRWQYCDQPPDRDLLFGYGPAHEIKRKLLTLWNSLGFLVRYANIEGFRPTLCDLASGPIGVDLRPLDRCCAYREDACRRNGCAGAAAHPPADRWASSPLSTTSRTGTSADPGGVSTATTTLPSGPLVTGLRVISPVMPFLAEHLWRNLVADVCAEAPENVFLAGWPELGEPDERLLAEISEVRRVVELGREARSTAGVKLRQPLRRVYVRGARLAQEHAQEIAEELRVDEVGFDQGPGLRFGCCPTWGRSARGSAGKCRRSKWPLKRWRSSATAGS